MSRSEFLEKKDFVQTLTKNQKIVLIYYKAQGSR